jgi:hypothetical protein
MRLEMSPNNYAAMDKGYAHTGAQLEKAAA